jgi:hypothetical protein
LIFTGRITPKTAFSLQHGRFELPSKSRKTGSLPVF